MNGWEYQFYHFCDRWLIILYRLVPNPIIGFFLGTFLLAFLTVIIGEFTVSVAFLANRKYVDRLNNELIKWNDLSVEAIEAGDKETYKACNNQANEVFGKVFFLSLAYAASSLWPAPFALAWMQYRFGSVELPLPFYIPSLGDKLGFAALFVLVYILARYIFGFLRPHLPYFRTIDAMLSVYEKEQAKMKSFGDLLEKSIERQRQKALEEEKKKAEEGNVEGSISPH